MPVDGRVEGLGRMDFLVEGPSGCGQGVEGPVGVEHGAVPEQVTLWDMRGLSCSLHDGAPHR